MLDQITHHLLVFFPNESEVKENIDAENQWKVCNTTLQKDKTKHIEQKVSGIGKAY